MVSGALRRGEAAVGDDHRTACSSRGRTHALDRLDDGVPLNHLTEHNVAAIEPRGGSSAEEKLTAVCVWARIGHRQYPRALVLELKILVWEFGSVD